MNYNDFMRDQIFTVCENNSVLEFGAFNGRHSRLILENAPERLSVVEPNDSKPGYPAELKQEVDFHNCTLNDFYSYTGKSKVDVVVICGLFYHLHSPIHALELILNNSDPDVIVFDSPEAGSKLTPNVLAYDDEVPNIPGSAYSDNSITKRINLRNTNPYAIVKCILEEQFGFSEEQYVLPDLDIELAVQYADYTDHSKTSTIVSVFKK